MAPPRNHHLNLGILKQTSPPQPRLSPQTNHKGVAMHFHCHTCDHSFDAEDPRPRCPSCMRLSTVEASNERAGFSISFDLQTWLRPPRVLGLIGGLLLVLGGGGGAYWWSQRPAPPTPHTFSAQEEASAARINAAEALWILSLRHTSGAQKGAERLIGQREGLKAARALGDLIQRQQSSELLAIIQNTLPRPALSPSLLADNTITEMFAGEAAYLYPDELSALLWSIAFSAKLDVDLVWLNPEELTIQRWPSLALRVKTPNGALAIDPHTGALRPSDKLEGFGPELIWSALDTLNARHAIQQKDTDNLEQLIEKIEHRTPTLWTLQVLRAELALLQNDSAKAIAAAQILQKTADHPLAWYVEARVDTQKHTEQDTQLLIQRYQALIQAFPLEAQLAVEWGDLLRAKGDFQASKDAYETALNRSPEVIGAHTGLAWLLALSAPERAIIHAREELRAHISHAPAYLALTFIHYLLNEPKEAALLAEQGARVTLDSKAFAKDLLDVQRQAKERRLDGSKPL